MLLLLISHKVRDRVDCMQALDLGMYATSGALMMYVHCTMTNEPRQQSLVDSRSWGNL